MGEPNRNHVEIACRRQWYYVWIAVSNTDPCINNAKGPLGRPFICWHPPHPHTHVESHVWTHIQKLWLWIHVMLRFLFEDCFQVCSLDSSDFQVEQFKQFSFYGILSFIFRTHYASITLLDFALWGHRAVLRMSLMWLKLTTILCMFYTWKQMQSMPLISTQFANKLYRCWKYRWSIWM